MLSDWKLGFGRLIRAMLVQRYFVLACTALLTLLGVGLLSMKEDRYTASAMILVDDAALKASSENASKENMPEEQEVVKGETGDAISLVNHIELIKSASVMRRALKDLNDKGVDLTKKTETSGSLLSSVAEAIPSNLWPDRAGDFDEEGSEPALRPSPELLAFSRGVDVAAHGRSQLIRVTYTDTDAEHAAVGANALIDAYIQVRSEEQGIADETVATPSSDDTNPIEQKLTETRTQRTTAELDVVALSSKIKSVETALERNDPLSVTEIADNQSVRDLRTQINLFETELADLEATYGQDHPVLDAKQEQIALALQSLDGVIESIVAGFRNQLQGAEQRITVLGHIQEQQEQDLAEVSPEAGAADDTDVSVLDLEKKAPVQPPDIKIISRAEIPDEPSGPARMFWSFLFLIGGFLVSSSAAMAREATRRVVRDPGDLQALLANSKVWVIPRREPDDRRRNETDNLHHLITTTPYAHFSASVRNVYSRTVATLPDEQHTVMLSSAQPGDGKTTMSLCFAEVAANAGRSVVLVDTDFRRPKIHIRTGLGQVAGLSDWLEGTEPLRCKRPEGCEFYTITAGLGEMTHPDRWNTQTIRELLETLKDRFETVILDTPPVAALADPFLVAAESSMVLFVARYQHTKITYVRDLIGPLAERARRMELILTDVDLKAAAAHGFGAPMEYYQDTAGYYTE